jgi:hypothetical protein
MTNAELVVLKLAHRGFMVRLESGLYRWTAKSEETRATRTNVSISSRNIPARQQKMHCARVVQDLTDSSAESAARVTSGGVEGEGASSC